jgi:hypothetical protein
MLMTKKTFQTERVHTIMIQQNDLSEKATITLLNSMKSLKINAMLRNAHIKKSEGLAAGKVFQALILLAFQGKNLFRLLDSDRGLDLPCKDTYYRFLNQSKFAWRQFLLNLATHVIANFNQLTSKKRVKVFIIDDSLYSRARSKKVELLARVYDHTTGKMVKGFSMLTLGWSDGFSFIPLDFSMLSSATDSNRLVDVDSKVDKRTHGYKRRVEAVKSKPKCVSDMIDRVLNLGLTADYVLMDSWFTNEPMLNAMKLKGLNVIGMLKDMKQKYSFNGNLYTLKELRLKLKPSSFNDLIGSVKVTTKIGIPVKLVFVKNRNKRKEWLAILSTDQELEDSEVIRIYGLRWHIETFFKATKSLLKLASEFQGRSYDMLISHTTIVFTRYILLEWERRQHQDQRTIGGLFFLFCDEVKDIDFKDALQDLLSVFETLKNIVPKRHQELIKRQLDNWIQSQPSYIKLLIGDLCCES